MRGRGKGMDIETLQKPVPLVRAAMAARIMYEYMATGRHKAYIYRANRLPS